MKKIYLKFINYLKRLSTLDLIKLLAIIGYNENEVNKILEIMMEEEENV